MHHNGKGISSKKLKKTAAAKCRSKYFADTEPESNSKKPGNIRKKTAGKIPAGTD